MEFYVRNPKTNKLERQRIKQGINSIHTLKGRRALGENLIKEWNEKIRNGWTPYNDKNVVYDDNLEFQTFIKNYRKLKNKNGTFRYFASKFKDWIKSIVENSTVSTYRSKLRLFDAWLVKFGQTDHPVPIQIDPVLLI